MTNFITMLYRVHLAWEGFKLTMLVVTGTDCTCSYKSNYICTIWSLPWWSLIFLGIKQSLSSFGGGHHFYPHKKTIFVRDHSMIIHVQFGLNQFCCFWKKVFIHFPIRSYVKLGTEVLAILIFHLAQTMYILFGLKNHFSNFLFTKVHFSPGNIWSF